MLTECDITPIRARIQEPVRGSFGGEWVDLRIKELEIFLPDLLKAIIDRKIVGLHYTGSLSLPTVLQYGLRPRNFLEEHGIAPSNGHNDSYSNKAYVSFHEWQYVTDLRGYCSRAEQYRYNPQGMPPKCVSPLTDDLIEPAINWYKEEIERIGSKRRPSSDPIEELCWEQFRGIRLLEEAKTYLQQLKAKDLPEFLIQIVTANVPVVYMVTRPETFIIPRSYYHTEYMVKDGVPVTAIKIIIVPSTMIALTQRVLEHFGLQDEISVFPQEPFRAGYVRG